jgi:hypothetical protein
MTEIPTESGRKLYLATVINLYSRRLLGAAMGLHHPRLEPGDQPHRIGRLIVAAGFSGHGFKIAPAVGMLVADLVADGRSADPRIPASDFRLSRFAEDAPLKSPYPYVGAGQMR